MMPEMHRLTVFIATAFRCDRRRQAVEATAPPFAGQFIKRPESVSMAEESGPVTPAPGWSGSDMIILTYGGTVEAPSEVRSARSQGAGGGGFSGMTAGGFLISGSSSSSKEPSISGASSGRGGFLMMIGSPGARPGGLGTGSGMASAIVPQTVCSDDRD